MRRTFIRVVYLALVVLLGSSAGAQAPAQFGVFYVDSQYPNVVILDGNIGESAGPFGYEPALSSRMILPASPIFSDIAFNGILDSSRISYLVEPNALV